MQTLMAERQARRRSPGLAERMGWRESGQSHALAGGLAANCVLGAFGITDLGGG